MNFITKLQQHDAVVSMIDFKHWENPHAVNLNFKQAIQPVPGQWIRIDPVVANQNLGHLLRILNRKLLSRAENRRGLRLGSAFAFETGGFADRLHCHGMIECPHSANLTNLSELVTQAWAKTTWGYGRNVVEPCDDEWPEYFLKLRTKSDFIDAIPFPLWQLPLSAQHRT